MLQTLNHLHRVWVYLTGQVYPILVFALLMGTLQANAQWPVEGGRVPRIDIDIEEGYTVASRNYYLDAEFKITGYGIYNDFTHTVQIKGRGNNSWNLKSSS